MTGEPTDEPALPGRLRGFLDRLVGTESTLKRETVLFVVWPLFWFPTLMMFCFIRPENVAKYENVYRYALDTAFYFGLLIFGIQITPRVSEIFKGGTTRETTTVETPEGATMTKDSVKETPVALPQVQPQGGG